MWYRLGKFILKFRLALLVLLLVATAVMAFFARKIQMSYEFSRAIPTDNIKYRDYQSFLKRFGSDGNTVVLGIASDSFFTPAIFAAAEKMHQQLKQVKGVEAILDAPEAVNLVRDTVADKLVPTRIFATGALNQQQLDSGRRLLESLPFYKGLLYNPATHAYLFAVTVNKDTANSKSRSRLINDIMKPVQSFATATNLQVHVSGLPYIRTTVADRLQKELKWFLIGSLVLSAITLLLFFRSVSAMLMSLAVVCIGVVWSIGTMVLLGYKITLLTTLIPPLVVVIGVPNCIYFLNKYHTSYKDTGDKNAALITMVGRMGVVTLFCNIAAAIGLGVFALTKSNLLSEFGVIAGLNIMLLFVISLIFIPPVLSYLPVPKPREMKYLDNRMLERMLLRIETWTFKHTKWVYTVTIALVLLALSGMFKLKAEGFIVDDLPKGDVLYTDLKWFESNFGGLMPLEILVDTKKRNGLFRSLKPIEKIDSFSRYVAGRPEVARPLSLMEGIKFVWQGVNDGDSAYYAIPSEFEAPILKKYLKTGAKDSSSNNKQAAAMNKLLASFMDSAKQVARISVNMKDVGTVRLPVILHEFDSVAKQTFDTAHYNVTFTGSSVTYLEGSVFIINGLRDSVLWGFGLIALCMLYLFRSFRILLCSLIPNIIPLMITAGVMGWTGIALKPSTVLVFSVALGIAIDVTIRFLVNYKQELPNYKNDVKETLVQTIHHTGVSIVYTSLVLIAGFIIFCVSSFGSTKALGWLTSLTLIVGTFTNLILLPVLIWLFRRKK
ncbi:efflux RND transporter permease subunit [Deminuibacter soli]|uniref:RND transporter n=1 Tax=Deminuibacter soli TaxID=2291815 RepID=A0A3E1NPS5_9BACT|nr:MMPL family transporter [Deminuibacter soli]RFM29897.1 RND transporter [Deminuibacter soli]